MNEVDELLLEHFGKKGMHWGVRSSSSRQRNKELNKASKAKEKKTRVATIEKARASVSEGGKANRGLQRAEAAHAANKARLGSREARKILREARGKHYDEVLVSQQAKNGKEVAGTLLLAGAAGLAAYTISRALSRGG